MLSDFGDQVAFSARAACGNTYKSSVLVLVCRSRALGMRGVPKRYPIVDAAFPARAGVHPLRSPSEAPPARGMRHFKESLELEISATPSRVGVTVIPHI